MAAEDYFDQNDNHQSLAFNSLSLRAKKKKERKNGEKKVLFLQLRVLLGMRWVF